MFSSFGSGFSGFGGFSSQNQQTTPDTPEYEIGFKENSNYFFSFQQPNNVSKITSEGILSLQTSPPNTIENKDFEVAI